MANGQEPEIPIWAFEQIEIKNPDPTWQLKGMRESEELSKSLSNFGVLDVEHIGSTAIPNLPAKPIIDLMASISSFEDINEIVSTLSSNNWHYVPPELDKQHWRRFFVKVEDDKRVAHLHLMQTGEKRWDEQLKFRDTLRADSLLTEQYAEMKSRLAQRFSDDREKYTEAKSAFIQSVLRS